MLRTTLLTLALILACVACTSIPRVEVDAASGAGLSHFKTFAISHADGAPVDPAFGPTARKEAAAALRSALEARGLVASDPADAELIVTLRTVLEQRDDVTAFTHRQRYDVERRRVGVRTPVANIPLSEETLVVPRHETAIHSELRPDERLLVVDLKGAGSDELLWRGSTRMRGDRISLTRLRSHAEAVARRLPE